MASDLFNQMNAGRNAGGGFQPMQFMQELNKLKRGGGDPNAMIQSLVTSGRVSQAQVNAAMQRAQQIMQMLTPSAHR